MKLSIALPTSSMKGGEELFTRCLNSLWDQTFQDFEIVVTDNSDDDVVRSICDYYRTGINYYKNPIKGMAQNTNEAIRKSTGDLIKVLYMDDFLIDTEALEIIVKNFKGNWLVNACMHVDSFGVVPRTPHIPHYSDNIQEGNNTIGSPSVMTIKNGLNMYFDENMTWLLDCDYYKRMYDLYGEPVYLKEPLTAIGLHEDQMTNTMGDGRKLFEHEYMKKKYEGIN